MNKSACSLREVRRQETSYRISHCARVLADEHGLDGFTMDDLAAAAGVSRRTLFNYFPGKDSAVLGEKAAIHDSLLDTFRAGGPTGDLVSDIVALVNELLDTTKFDRDELSLVQRVMHDNPRLIALAKQDFEVRCEEFCEATEAREGAAYDDIRARVLVRVVAALFEGSLHYYLEHPDEELADLFNRSIGALRSAFQ
jgi:AcrR family transcriptional regulator